MSAFEGGGAQDAGLWVESKAVPVLVESDGAD